MGETSGKDLEPDSNSGSWMYGTAPLPTEAGHPQLFKKKVNHESTYLIVVSGQFHRRSEIEAATRHACFETNVYIPAAQKYWKLFKKHKMVIDYVMNTVNGDSLH